MKGGIPFDDLARLSNRTRPSAVKKWLQRQGVAYMLDADNRPITTERALNDALAGRRKTRPNWPIQQQ